MKGNAKKSTAGRTKSLQLGKYIVADPGICHGKPTFRGTRIMVWQILEELAQGMSPDDIIGAWGGKISRAAIAESVRLAQHSLLDKAGRLLRPEHVPVAA